MRSRTVLTAAVALLVVLSGVVAPIAVALGETRANETVTAGTPGKTTMAETSEETTPTETAGETSTAETPGEATTVEASGNAATAETSGAATPANDSVVREKVAAELRTATDGGRTAVDGPTATVADEASEEGRSVVVELSEERVTSGRAAVARILGPAAVGSVHDRYVRATATSEEVAALAGEASVEYVRPPARPVSLAGSDGTTEGVETANLDELHARGYGGENVTIAVIDVEPFELDNPALDGRVAATKDFTGDGVDGSGGHGTATAELVAETAPNASLVLVRVDSLVGFYEAVDWLETNTSTDVVSMSLGWYNVGPLDGTSEMDRAINGSVANGTSWVVSAGNSADGHHWNGTWNDSDDDGYLNVEGSREYFTVDGYDSGTVPFRVWATWDDWPDSDQDYDVCLYDDSDVENATPVRCSTNSQTGTQDPTEYLGLGVSDDDGDGSETLYLTVENRSADGTAEFDLFLNDRAVFRTSWTDARSLTLPATNRHALAVGAYDQADGSLEAYSSLGPTIDGRVKPDLVAADNVTSSVYGRFSGTSAAAPHVAGVLATTLDANRRLSPAELRRNVTESARPMGDVPNNLTGHGRADAARTVAGLGAYDLPPDGRLRYDGDYRVDTGGSAAPDAIVVDAANVTLDGEGLTFDAASDGVALSTTENATNLTVRDLRVTNGSAGIAARNLTALELTNLTADDATLELANVSAADLSNVSVAGDPSFDLSAENVSLATDESRAPPDRARLSVAPNLTLRDANASVTLRYDDDHVNGSTVAVWSRVDGEWNETNASVDADANAVSFEASENGTYGVYAVGLPAVDELENRSLSADVNATSTAAVGVSNVGRGNLTVLDADLVGPDADQYSLSDPPRNVTVRPGETLDVTVRYAPNRTGSHEATLAVTTGELGVVDAGLTGSASEPTPTSTPTPTPTPDSDDSSGSGGFSAPAPAPSTPEPTPTSTPAPTPTVTPTPTLTPTVTPTPTLTPTATPATRTPVLHRTPTPASTEDEASDGGSETPRSPETTQSPTEREGAGPNGGAAATPTVTGTGVPGFSPVTAVVAFAAVALLCYRRR